MFITKENTERREEKAMTRFQRELSGALGEHWVRSAKKEIEDFQKKADNGEILVDENGVATWKTNGRCLPEECCEKLSYSTFIFSIEATRVAREEETAAFLESYRKANANRRRSAEELNEMRSAFGTGTTVIDIITGERVRL